MYGALVVLAVVAVLGLAVKVGVFSGSIGLRDLKPGDVARFLYKGEQRLIKVLKLRDTAVDKLQVDTLRRRNIERTRFLVTGLCDGKVKSFYEEHIAENVVKVGYAARLCHWLLGVRFATE